ncbi:MAG: T9SS type A sorting domain-containing protein [Candidatus Cyclobacteriaceae bacterium M2_1C_046]
MRYRRHIILCLLTIFALLPSLSIKAQQIVTGEYFFNTDPGPGMGVPFSFTANDTLDITFSADASALPAGFHTLYTRVLGDSGFWSHTEARKFHIQAAQVFDNNTYDITNGEYFFDNDPGPGNGVAFSFTQGQSIDITQILDASALTPGFHNAFIRVKNTLGIWSHIEKRTFYISETVTVDNTFKDIVEGEYFFDADPGLGNGTAFTITANDTINVTPVVDASALTPGFHQLHIRVKNNVGIWSHYERRIIYISETPTGTVTASPITAVEYFIDNDPGPGNGTAISLTAADTINQTFIAQVADTVPVGFHTISFRAKNDLGVWSMVERRNFYKQAVTSQDTSKIVAFEYFFDVDPGFGNGTVISVTASDSIDQIITTDASSLLDGTHVVGVRARTDAGFYSWTSIDTFQVFNGPVSADTTIIIDEDVAYNFSTGSFPFYPAPTNNPLLYVRIIEVPSSGYLTLFSDTVIAGAEISESLLASLIYTPLPDHNGLPGDSLLFKVGDADTVSLSDHTMYFDVTPVNDPPSFTHSGDLFLNKNFLTVENVTVTPDPVPSDEVDQTVTYSLSPASVTFANVSINSGTGKVTVTAVADQTGSQVFTITANDAQPANNTFSSTFLLSVSDAQLLAARKSDSLALVAIYDSLSGVQWNNSTNWKTTKLESWYGVTIKNSRVQKLDLNNNSLSGILPPEIKDLTIVDTLNLAGNSIYGNVPSEVLRMKSLQYLDLSGNAVDSLPPNMVSSLTALRTVDVTNNSLQFGSLEVNAEIPNFLYAEQDTVNIPPSQVVNAGESLDIVAPVSGVNNAYQWYKDGFAITGANSKTFTIPAIDFPDEGYYYSEVTNSVTPGLIIYTSETFVAVAGLRADSLALVDFYNQNGGDSWISKAGWLQDNISTWEGVMVSGGRVTELVLPENNITGDLAPEITVVTELAKIDLSGNKLTGLPDLTVLSKLTYLDLAENKLNFSSLKPNAFINGIIYSPQDSIGTGEHLILPVHSNATLSINTPGADNQYQWLQNGSPVGLNKTQYQIIDLTKEKTGRYTVWVTNPNVPGLTLIKKMTVVDGIANITGTIRDAAGSLLSNGGTVAVYQVVDADYGFTPMDTVEIKNDGTFIVSDLLLRDYLVLASADGAAYPTLVPTYYSSHPTLFWEDTDTLSLTDHYNLELSLVNFNEEPLNGEGSLSGFVEIETEEGRLKVRKRIKSAGVSVRRGVRSGRQNPAGRGMLHEFELVSYIETDEQGTFTFPNLPNDTYYLNVQYPGVPMDTTTYTTIEVKSNNTQYKNIEVAALVDRDFITVEQVNVTSVYSDIAYDKIIVYPNPASAMITVDLSAYNEQFDLRIFNMQGAQVLEKEEIRGKEIISLNEYSAGTYIIRISNESGDQVSSLKLFIE